MKFDDEEKELLEETNKFIEENPHCFKSIPPMYETLYKVVKEQNDEDFSFSRQNRDKKKVKSIFRKRK